MGLCVFTCYLMPLCGSLPVVVWTCWRDAVVLDAWQEDDIQNVFRAFLDSLSWRYGGAQAVHQICMRVLPELSEDFPECSAVSSPMLQCHFR
jgi:hypothetical protein